MPCNTVSRVQLKLKASIVRMDLLKEAVEQAGHRILQENQSLLIWESGSYSKVTEQVTERSEAAANQIRKNYATKLTERALKRHGWKIHQQKVRG